MELNLANLATSQIKYKIVKYPDTHTHLDLSIDRVWRSITQITIKTRLSTMDEVFVLLQAVDAIRNVNKEVRLKLSVSYLLCARYDRAMYDGDSFDLKIITDLINQQGFDSIELLEPHSNMSSNLLRATVVHPLDATLKNALAITGTAGGPKDSCLVSPDLGAIKRVEDFAKTLPYEIPILLANKDRNIRTGEIRGINIMNPDALRTNIFIYDDLCDGGRTFIELAKAIRKTNPVFEARKITLVVTHGLFSQGISVILKDVDRIITTNSYQPLTQYACPELTVVEVI